MWFDGKNIYLLKRHKQKNCLADKGFITDLSLSVCVCVCVCVCVGGGISGIDSPFLISTPPPNTSNRPTPTGSHHNPPTHITEALVYPISRPSSAALWGTRQPFSQCLQLHAQGFSPAHTAPTVHQRLSTQRERKEKRKGGDRKRGKGGMKEK